MKRILAAILLSTLILSSASCGQSEPEKKSETAAQTAAETEAETAAETETTVETEAAVELPGGWSMAESPDVTEEVSALLEKATDDLLGAAYSPVAYIGSQPVSGTNHALLCTITPVVPDAVGTYAVVILYEDPHGNVEITKILNSEAEAEIPVDSEVLLGGWTAPESLTVTEEAEAALAKASEKKLGADYEALALLATQVVSGTNYSLLCRVTAVTPEAEPACMIVHVYEDTEGNAEITDIWEFSAAE